MVGALAVVALVGVATVAFGYVAIAAFGRLAIVPIGGTRGEMWRSQRCGHWYRRLG